MCERLSCLDELIVEGECARVSLAFQILTAVVDDDLKFIDFSPDKDRDELVAQIRKKRAEISA